MRKTSKIYVAGHNGLVGSAIVRKLQEERHRNILTFSRQELDLTNKADTETMFRLYQPRYVFLAAAKVGGIRENIECPADLLYINLTNVSTSKSKSGFAGIAISQSCVNVNITARVVNAATGSIVIASNSSGSVTLTSAGMQGIGAGGRTNVSDNDVLNAAEKAIKKLTVELAAKSSNLR